MISTYPAQARIYLDESGMCHKLARTHGYSPKGRRVHGLTYGQRKGRTNVIGAWSSGRKLFATRTYERSINKAVFTQWLCESLCPILRAGQVVIMDNAPWHKGADIRNVIEATGADLVMLPPYSPDLSGFQSAGGKMIVPHGNSDPVFSVLDTIDWWNAVNAAQKGRADEFVRVFPVPGMTHCAGGASLDRLDSLNALEDWVENDRPPQQIKASAGAPWPERKCILCPLDL